MREVLTEFLQEVRAAGIPVSLAEGIDALRAAAAAGVERERLREALAAAMVKDEIDRPAFDEVFGRFFSSGRPRRAKKKRVAAGGAAAGAGKGEPSSVGTPKRADRPHRPAPQPIREHEQRAGERRADLDRRRARRRLLAKPFRELDPLEAEELSALADEIASRFQGRMRRRLCPAARHGRLDFRRTLRRSIEHGGAALELELRRRRPGRIDVVALCDVSGSVRHATDFFVALLGPCAELLRSLRVFAFIDHAVPATIEAGRLIPETAMDFHAFSDLGQTLVELELNYASALTRSTLLLVLGDARNNRRPARADVLGRLRSRVRAVWWLAAEPRARWGTGDSAIELYRPHCDAVLECADAGSLLAALDRLAR